MKTLAFACQKGGVAKTTTTTTTAALFTREGKRVVIIDLDPQRNATEIALPDPPRYTVLDALQGMDPRSALQSSEFGFILASDAFLSDSSIKALSDLQSIIKALSRGFDYCLIDCPPSLGKLTVSALTCADYAVICTSALPAGYNATIATAETIQGIRERGNKGLQIAGILPTRVNLRTGVTRAYIDSLQGVAAGYNTVCFSPVRESVVMVESQIMNQPIYTYASKAPITQDYEKYFAELKERIKA